MPVMIGAHQARAQTDGDAETDKGTMTQRQLRRTATDFRTGLLDGRSSHGMCFAVCAALQGWLSVCGVETEMVEANFVEINHVWLLLPNGDILDPTADQFGLDPVYIGRLPFAYEARTARLVGGLA